MAGSDQYERFSVLLREDREAADSLQSSDSDYEVFFETRTGLEAESRQSDFPIPPRRLPQVPVRNLQPTPRQRQRPVPRPRISRLLSSTVVSESRNSVAAPALNTQGSNNPSVETFIDNAYARYVDGTTGDRDGLQNPLLCGAQPTVQVYEPPTSVARPLHSTAFPGTEYSRIPRVESRTVAPDSKPDSTRLSDTTENLLRTLVSEFTSAIRDEKSRPTAAPRCRVELRPTRFDGSGDVHLFIKQFAEIAKLSEWDDQMAVVQIRSCLDKSARDAGRADTLHGIFGRLLSMFGLTASAAREKLHHLSREPGESYLKLGSRVEKLTKLAYGGLGPEVENQMAIESFDRALDEPALRQHLLLAGANTLEETVKAAERYALVSCHSSRSIKSRDTSARVVAVEASPVFAEAGSGQDLSFDQKFERLSLSLTEKLDAHAKLIREQSTRLSAIEQKVKSGMSGQQKAGVSNEKGQGQKVCYQCGDPSHFKRNCPILAQKRGTKDVRKPTSTTESEN